MLTPRFLPAALTATALAAALVVAWPAFLQPTGASASVSAPLPLPSANSRVFVANEGSTSISVIRPIDPATGALTNQIVNEVCLGSDPADDLPGTPGAALASTAGGHSPSPCDGEADHHKPLYDGHAGTHGLWLTADGSVLIATNRLSGTVVAIDTAAAANPCAVKGCPNAVLAYTPVGREPHLATMRPGTNQAWVAIRGENYLDVLKISKDSLAATSTVVTERMKRIGEVVTMLGPSMVTFTSDGSFAFVAAGKQARVDKFDLRNLDATELPAGPSATQSVSAPFTPFGLVTPDDQELYLVHKVTGKLSILRTSDLSFVVQDLPIGPRANHVAFLGNLAYVTIAGAPGLNGDPDQPGGIVVINRSTHRIVAASPALLTEPLTPGGATLAQALTALGIDPTTIQPYAATADFSDQPHGIWPVGRLLYVGHEAAQLNPLPNPRVTVIDTGADAGNPLDDVVLGAVVDPPLMKQPIDVVGTP